jgi:signal transduction histidine kinase
MCESSVAQVGGREVSEGIRALMSGERESFCFVYQCSDGPNDIWFQLRVNRFVSQGMLRLVLAHEDVTEIKSAHVAMQEFNVLLLRAQDEERGRIARDLHDVTAQNLAVIKADLIQVQKFSRNMDSVAREALTEVMLLSDQVIKELRTVSYLLHPPLLDEAGLVPAIGWYVRGFMQRSGIKVEMPVMLENGRLRPDLEAVIYRVVQEGLTNIHRHSGSASAVLSLFRQNGDVVVQIQDHGCGIVDLETVSSPGVGLLGMRQRLNQLGGHLEIDSGPQGTTITARAPILEKSSASYSRR